MAEMAKFVEVALVVVARVNTPVDAVEAPIAVELIVPPEMVRSSATSLSAQSNERGPVFWSAPLSTLPAEEMVRAAEVYASEGGGDVRRGECGRRRDKTAHCRERARQGADV